MAIATGLIFQHFLQAGPKKLTILIVDKLDNFATVNDRKACYMSKVCRFCLETSIKLHISAFKYFLLICINIHSPCNCAEFDSSA